jgi:hypothetical protein
MMREGKGWKGLKRRGMMMKRMKKMRRMKKMKMRKERWIDKKDFERIEGGRMGKGGGMV